MFTKTLVDCFCCLRRYFNVEQLIDLSVDAMKYTPWLATIVSRFVTSR